MRVFKRAFSRFTRVRPNHLPGSETHSSRICRRVTARHPAAIKNARTQTEMNIHKPLSQLLPCGQVFQVMTESCGS